MIYQAFWNIVALSHDKKFHVPGRNTTAQTQLTPCFPQSTRIFKRLSVFGKNSPYSLLMPLSFGR
jgi:hypothetical protein